MASCVNYASLSPYSWLKQSDHVLIVLAKSTDLVMRSLRNLPYIYVTTADLLTTYEVAFADSIVMTKDAVKMIEDRLVKAEGKVKVVAQPKETAVVEKAAP